MRATLHRNVNLRRGIIRIHQCCPSRGPRAACGRPTNFMRPARAG